ncbi:neutral/alkaline non-lysosomal ceramidase [Truncatella angustata]|uniref:Neutral ceramidase n=1 Tax=Truncatella angustata TaxID=152316 RepID=A0A9P8UIE5_9PEZI|nr:neutral/alkaline non-lysosomal ceramidase [Truncatella angustata]KAH6652701.1 neutral/alkaline non-lysosomal ceramidase [Truncatella angustata]
MVVILLIPVLVFVALLPTGLNHKLGLWTTVFGNAGGENGGSQGVLGAHETAGDRYLLGVGKADITGPCVEINLMGYADPNQIGTGLRQRLYSRAFIVGDPDKPSDRFIYLVLDTQSGDTAVRYGILSGLQELGHDYVDYGHHNLAVTGTHSHSGPGAWLNYLLPQITSKGFNKQSYQAIVDGALLSIRRAHESLAPGHLSVGTTKVFGANINRSLYAYLNNSEKERAQYNISSEDDGSVEKDLTLLKFTRASDSKSLGVLSWFPTHGTSVLGNNTLISGDNKGVAAYLFEESVKDDESADDSFVAGFSQASVGDTSPNVLGAWCEDGTGQMCSFENSTCSDGRSQKCHARGPFFRADDEGTSSCYEIGKRQFEPARMLYDQSNKLSPIRGRWVKSFHKFHNMSNFRFQTTDGRQVQTCPAALGYSFAAGTSDGPGAFDFTQHDGGPNTTSPVWQVVGGLLKAPSEQQKACHGAKPILLDVGEVTSPYLWTPNVVDVQVFRVGQLVIIVSAGEATTMAGRRWKSAVGKEITALFANEVSSSPPVVVLGGPANSYTHYITTEEEYEIQRYEGASTLYGPHTLAAYINVTLSLVPYLSATSTGLPSPGPSPPDNSNRSLSFVPGVVHDRPPLFKKFGDVTTDVEPVVYRGSSVSAVFVGANPRNNLRLERSYAAVEKLITDLSTAEKQWQPVRDDSDWHLVFRWRRTSELLATSEVTITWETEQWAEPGIYRLRYYGDAKSISGSLTEFDGVTGEFQLI